MVAYPTVQKRIQKEIDDVIGPNRFPEFEDFERLPYLKAVINEVRFFVYLQCMVIKMNKFGPSLHFQIYRLRPTVPLAIPHATTIDQRVRSFVSFFFSLEPTTQ